MKNIRKINNFNVLDELFNYINKEKAERVYRKALRNRKYKLAEAIAKKYNIEIYCDRVMALGLTLNYLKNGSRL